MSEQQTPGTITGTAGEERSRYWAIKNMAVGEVVTYMTVDFSENPADGSYNPISLRGVLSYYKLRYGRRMTMHRARDGSATVTRLG